MGGHGVSGGNGRHIRHSRIRRNTLDRWLSCGNITVCTLVLERKELLVRLPRCSWVDFRRRGCCTADSDRLGSSWAASRSMAFGLEGRVAVHLGRAAMVTLYLVRGDSSHAFADVRTFLAQEWPTG